MAENIDNATLVIILSKDSEGLVSRQLIGDVALEKEEFRHVYSELSRFLPR